MSIGALILAAAVGQCDHPRPSDFPRPMPGPGVTVAVPGGPLRVGDLVADGRAAVGEARAGVREVREEAPAAWRAVKADVAEVRAEVRGFWSSAKTAFWVVVVVVLADPLARVVVALSGAFQAAAAAIRKG